MRRGDFAAAWRVSDRMIADRRPGEQCWHLPRHEEWVWDGRPLADRTVLVRCYHGLGDTIQFARFLPMLSSVARETIVWAQPALLGLLATLPGVRRLLPLHNATPDVEYDVDIESMELAHALRIGAESLSAAVPYFDVPRGPRLSDRFSVGVLARAGDWDVRRSVPVDMFAWLTERCDVAAFNLQLESPLAGMADLSTPDFGLLASRVRSLDLVLTPDTMLAHLAGALGVATWTLLPADPDWRWMGSERTDSPWYPSMRLFRQPSPGDWRSPIAEVERSLARLVPRQRS
jgi:hypothetical protein